MADVKVLYYLSQPYGNCILKEMGDIGSDTKACGERTDRHVGSGQE